MITIQSQFAIFLDNRPGTLAATCRALATAQVNLLALAIVDTVDHVIVRLVVDKANDAERVLSRLHAMVQRREVVVIEVSNEAGALARIAEQLAQAGINIEYAYCTASSSQRGGLLVLRTNDLEATINALS